MKQELMHRIIGCFSATEHFSLKDIYAAVASDCACVVMEGDGRNLSALLSESIDCIITDHPWLDKIANKGGNRSFSDYDCFRYTVEDFREKARVLKPGCFLAEFIPAENESNFKYLYELKQMAIECGLEYYCKVSWKKGRFVSNTGRKAKNTQEIMIFSKGRARELRLDVKRSRKEDREVFMSGTRGMLPAMFDVDPVSKEERIHQSQLPVELCEQLISFLTLEGEVILDQYAGSGSVGVAACQRQRSSILIEKAYGMVELMKERINHTIEELELQCDGEDEKSYG